MAFATMHFGVGMLCGGAIATVGCLTAGRGWRYVPVAMTLGGLWAMAPDMPRIFREDIPGFPFAAVLGNPAIDRWLLSDLFFFHRSLDSQPSAFALHGLVLILALYNLVIAAWLVQAHRVERLRRGAPGEDHRSVLRKLYPDRADAMDERIKGPTPPPTPRRRAG